MKTLLLSLGCALLLTFSAAGLLAANGLTSSSLARLTRAPNRQFLASLVQQLGAAIGKSHVAATSQQATPDCGPCPPNNDSDGPAQELAYLATWRLPR